MRQRYLSAQYFAQELKTQILNLVDELIEILPNEKDILMARIYFDMLDENRIIQGFLRHVVPQRNYIENKDERYFTDNDYIFGDLPKDKVRHFKEIYEKDNMISKDDKEVIWEYFQIFIKICDNYKKFE